MICSTESAIPDLQFGIGIRDLEFAIRDLEFATRGLEFAIRHLEFAIRGLEFGIGDLEFAIGNLEFGIGTRRFRHCLLLAAYRCFVLSSAILLTRCGRGEVSEWLKEHAWKACSREIVTWVRIPPSPPPYAKASGGAPPGASP